MPFSTLPNSANSFHNLPGVIKPETLRDLSPLSFIRIRPEELNAGRKWNGSISTTKIKSTIQSAVILKWNIFVSLVDLRTSKTKQTAALTIDKQFINSEREVTCQHELFSGKDNLHEGHKHIRTSAPSVLF